MMIYMFMTYHIVNYVGLSNIKVPYFDMNVLSSVNVGGTNVNYALRVIRVNKLIGVENVATPFVTITIRTY